MTEPTSEETRNESTVLEGSAPRCRVGSKTDNPCWREAVEPRFSDGESKDFCAEHARVAELTEDLEAWFMNLVAIDEWIKGPVAEAQDDDLTRLAYNLRDEARQEYGTLAVRLRAARMVAEREPGEPLLSLEREEALGHLLAKEETLNNVRTMLEDADEDALNVSDRWLAIHVLACAAHDAHLEAGRLQRETGVRVG